MRGSQAALIALCLVGSAVNAAPPDDVEVFDVDRVRHAAAAEPRKCPDSCADSYRPAEQHLDERKSCETGCTLLSIIETIDVPPGQLDFDDALESCHKSCDASFLAKEKADSCFKGCSAQVPVSVYRRKNMPEPPPMGMMAGFPRIRIGFALPFGGSSDGDDSSDDFGMMPDFGGMMSSMRRHMDSMMGRMRAMMSGEGGGEGDMMGSMMDSMMQHMGDGQGQGGGRGRLTVIKSGPGYHEEKTYNFGPGGVMRTETRTSGQRQGKEVEERPMGPDMMDVLNPLERYFNRDDVEVLDNGGKKGDEGDSLSVPAFDINLDGPRLPHDGGLKTRLLGDGAANEDKYFDRRAFCAGDGRNLKWSDWVSCLHLRMGLPRWLTAATISLGVVFIIWLCLVIPNNAPKQRVRKAKALEAAGRLESAYMTAPAGLVNAKLDLPPAYDVACLHVAVPAADTEHTQAGPLPVKTPIEENEKVEEGKDDQKI